MKAIKFLRNVVRTFAIMEQLEKELNRELTQTESDLMMTLAVTTKYTNDEIVKEIKEMNAQ